MRQYICRIYEENCKGSLDRMIDRSIIGVIERVCGGGVMLCYLHRGHMHLLLPLLLLFAEMRKSSFDFFWSTQAPWVGDNRNIEGGEMGLRG